MRAVVFTGAGGNEVIDLVERPDPVPSGDDVLVAVRYAGLNPADIAQREGRYPAPPGSPPDVPGIEVSGTVIACGPTARRFAIGDRVFGIVGGGGLADRVLVHERHVASVPDVLDDLAAAAVPEVFVTAHDAVMSQASFGRASFSSSTARTAGSAPPPMQIAAVSGARVLATVRDEALRDDVAKLGATVIAPDSLVERAIAEGGADVILELVGAPNLDPDLRALAVKGRIVIVGTGGGTEAPLDLRKLMGRRARLMGTVLRARPLEEKAAAVQSFAREVVPHLATGRIRSLVDRVFPAGEAAAAFDRLQSPGKLGKVLLDFEASAPVIEVGVPAEVAGERLGAVDAAGIGEAVCPFAEQCLDECFGFAVGLWSAGSGVAAADLEFLAGGGPGVGAVAVAVV